MSKSSPLLASVVVSCLGAAVLYSSPSLGIVTLFVGAVFPVVLVPFAVWRVVPNRVAEPHHGGMKTLAAVLPVLLVVFVPNVLPAEQSLEKLLLSASVFGAPAFMFWGLLVEAILGRLRHDPGVATRLVLLCAIGAVLNPLVLLSTMHVQRLARVEQARSIGRRALPSAVGPAARLKGTSSAAELPSEPRGSVTTGSPEAAEEAVVIEFALSTPFGSREDVAALQNLEDALLDTISRSGLGEFDGNEIGEGTYTLYMYGPSADRLYEGIRPLVLKSGLLARCTVTRRYGPAGAREIRSSP